MKTKNDTLNAIQTMVDSAVSKAGYDKTRNAVILARNTNNTYKIKMDGIEYDNVVCYGAGVLRVGEVAKVFIPNGQASQMYILAINPYPVGSIYQTTDGDFEPSIVWGGVWERIKGKVLVGVDEDDADFDESGLTGGNKKHTHTYKFVYGGYYGDVAMEHNASAGIVDYAEDDTETIPSEATETSVSSIVNNNNTTATKTVSHAQYSRTANVKYTSSLQPYETVYIWKRTA